MRTASAAAFVLAALIGCNGGLTQGTSGLGDGGGPPIGSIPGGGDGGGLDAGDGGPDGGDGGQDGGADAGCVALTLPGVPAIDGCHGGVSTTATGTVNLANCSIDLQLPTFAGPCSGFVSGPSNAFDGGCEADTFRCTSTSLPGDLTCVFATGICAIRICDAGATCP